MSRAAPNPRPIDASPIDAAPICPLRGRPIPADARRSAHHLTPKLKGGKHGPTVRPRQICHTAIHATLSEAEIARRYASVEALRAHPDIARFLAWVATKPPRFHARTAGGRRHRR